MRARPRAHAEISGAASLEQAFDGVEQRLLGITRRWLGRTVLSGAAALASGCSGRPEATPLGAGAEPHTVPPVPDAAPAAPSEEQARAARAYAAEQALLAEQLLLTPKGKPLDVTAPAPGGGKPLKCREDQPLFPVRASGLSIERASEYLELRSLQLASEGRSAVEQFTVVDRLGTPCASASSGQCRATLAGAISQAHASSCLQLCVGYSVVTSEGDHVKQWSGPAELRQLLGEIVSENDALLLVAASGYQLECGNPARSTIRKLKDGFEVYATRITSSCSPVESTRYRLQVSTRGELRELDALVVSRGWDACIGREPAGLMPTRGLRGGSALGDFLAHCARLEQASVYAFERMGRELAALDAPHVLIARAQEAAHDERRHAAVMNQLAHARGGCVEPAQVAAYEPRSLEQMACENVVEGCVRETYGALLGAHQAAHARDAQLRTAMREIARDELRHATLSHAVHAWLSTQLNAAARARLTRAREEAITELQASCADADEPVWHADAGLPSPALARELLSELQHNLWAELGPDSRVPV